MDGLVINGGRGSSPRVRGKPRDAIPWRVSSGLIPARAGKTGVRGPVINVAQAHPRACGENREQGTGNPPAHPRACGENDAFAVAFDLAVGSSPRVRGKRQDPRRRRAHARLIPARAGKTRRQGLTRHGARAHPRACGENGTYSHHAAFMRGSSPRVRGKRNRAGSPIFLVRLIPARAGKTTTPAARHAR